MILFLLIDVWYDSGNMMKIMRGLRGKRGHQHHGGNRMPSSNVDAEQVLAALRVGDQMPIPQMYLSSNLEQQESVKTNRNRKKHMSRFLTLNHRKRL